MLILGIDTCTGRTSVALGSGDGVLASASLARPTAHGGFLAPAIEFCLRQAGAGVGDLHGVAVTLGPGLFTGMRVGIATAQALAHARRLPVVGLASLDLLAFRVRHARRPVCAVLDAKRKELFWAFYRPVPGGVQREGEFRVGPAEKLAAELEASGQDTLCVGDGAVAHRSLLESAGADVDPSPALASPHAESLVELAVPRFLREETQRAEELRPVYLRQADARIGWRERGVLSGGMAGPSGGGPAAGEAG
ncbi:MAG TPA: tRNA (adenosine(37)-N6)-threonylcarbamoyltransferase complex dimerization subunit type 1 TsaB [Egibacteraceae bacterium]|nr:tRNA (adenosine(37)-N6)-threonylcarbamoyltransferase complex dimerization subunit type 1 TsaB [Egibacteraceae bacterium]